MYHYRPQRSWGKVMFSQASVILLTGGCLPQCMLGYTPREQTPPGGHPPQIPPQSRPPRSRHRWEQTPPYRNRHYPMGADPPPDTPRSRHPPKQTRPRSRHPPRADTPWEQTPPLEQTPSPQSMLGDTVNARAVRILLECNLVLFNHCLTTT